MIIRDERHESQLFIVAVLGGPERCKWGVSSMVAGEKNELF